MHKDKLGRYVRRRRSQYGLGYTPDCYLDLEDNEVVLAINNYPCPDRTKQHRFGYCLITNQGPGPITEFPIKGWYFQSLKIILTVLETLDPKYNLVYIKPKQLVWGIYNAPLRKSIRGKRFYYHMVSKKILQLITEKNVSLVSPGIGTCQTRCNFLGIDLIIRELGRVDATKL